MGYSYQRYLVAMDGTLYRMANTAFDRVLSEPARHRVPELAGQRVRTVEVVVELAGREPVAVVRQAFAVLAFDATGSVDVSRLRKQQYARIETALAPVFANPRGDEKIFDAGEQFVAQGGTWTPSRALARAIDNAALGRQRCPRLDHYPLSPHSKKARLAGWSGSTPPLFLSRTSQAHSEQDAPQTSVFGGR